MLKSKLAVIGATGLTAMGLVFTLTACNPLAAITENAAEKAVEDATGGSVDIDAGGGVSMPADWPAEVPVIDAKLFTATAIGEGTSRTWTILFQVDDPAKAYDAAKADLVAAGFSTELDSSMAEGSYGQFSNANYSVSVTAAPGVSGEKAILSYTVMPKQ